MHAGSLTNTSRTWGRIGGGNGEFFHPSSVTVDGKRNVFVTEMGKGRVQVFDMSGNFIGTWGQPGSADGEFQSPWGVAVDRLGEVYVVDTNNHRIQVFDQDGNFLRKWGHRGSGDGEFMNPVGIAVDRDGVVFVSDTGNHRIQVFTSNGDVIAKWGHEGTKDEDFQEPLGIAIDSEGHVYVADFLDDSIKKFYSNGTFITKLTTSEDGTRLFHYPRSISIDSDGILFVAGIGGVTVLDNNGTYIRKWGTQWGQDEGKFDWIADAVVDGKGNIFVVDKGNHRIQKFSYSRSTMTEVSSPTPPPEDLSYSPPRIPVLPNVRVDTGPVGSNAVHPDIDTDVNGSLYVAWQDDRQGVERIYFAQAFPMQTGFSDDVEVFYADTDTEQTGPALSSYPYGHLTVAWVESAIGRRTIRMAESPDRGHSFEEVAPPWREDDGAVRFDPVLAQGWGREEWAAWVELPGPTEGSGTGTGIGIGWSAGTDTALGCTDICPGFFRCFDGTCSTTECIAGYTLCAGECYLETGGKCCDDAWHADGECCSTDDCLGTSVCDMFTHTCGTGGGTGTGTGTGTGIGSAPLPSLAASNRRVFTAQGEFEGWVSGPTAIDEGFPGANRDGPDLAVHHPEFGVSRMAYLVMDGTREGIWSIALSNATRPGEPFERPMIVRECPEGTRCDGSAVAVDRNGVPWVAWRVADTGGERIVCGRGDGMGGNPVAVASASGRQGVIGPPDIATGPDGTVYVVWSEDRWGHSDVFISASPDGRTFSRPLRVNDDLGTADQLNPRIVVTDMGQVVITWQDNRGCDGSKNARNGDRFNNDGDFYADDPGGTPGMFDPLVDEIFATDDGINGLYDGTETLLFEGATPGVQTMLGGPIKPLVDEDPVDDIDNDGDGFIDEDGHSGDGLIDEDDRDGDWDVYVATRGPERCGERTGCPGQTACMDGWCSYAECDDGRGPCGHICVDLDDGACCNGVWHLGVECCVDNDCDGVGTCNNGTCVILNCPDGQDICGSKCVDLDTGRCCTDAWYPGGECCANADCDAEMICVSGKCSRMSTFTPSTDSPWLLDVLDLGPFKIIDGAAEWTDGYLLVRGPGLLHTGPDEGLFLMHIDLAGDRLSARTIGSADGAAALALQHNRLLVHHDSGEGAPFQRVHLVNGSLVLEHTDHYIGNLTSVTADGARFVLCGPDALTIMWIGASERVGRLQLDNGTAACSGYDWMVSVVQTGGRQVHVHNSTYHLPLWSSPELDDVPASLLLHDGRIYAGTPRGRLVAWNLTRGPGERTLPGHTGPLQVLAADDRYVYTGGADGMIKVREIDTLFGRFTLRGHESPVMGIVPLGERVLSFDNRTVRLWQRPRRPEPVVATPTVLPNVTVVPNVTLVPNEILHPSPTEPSSNLFQLVYGSCGDDVCDADEDYGSCCRDCGCPQGQTCTDDGCLTLYNSTSVVPTPSIVPNVVLEEPDGPMDYDATDVVKIVLVLGIGASALAAAKQQ